MKKLYAVVGFLFLCLFLPVQAKTPQGVTYDAVIVRVSDGDTVVIAAPFLPPPFKQELAVQVKTNVVKQHQHLPKMQLINQLNVKRHFTDGISSVVVS
jgi:hypothetical protein